MSALYSAFGNRADDDKQTKKTNNIDDTIELKGGNASVSNTTKEMGARGRSMNKPQNAQIVPPRQTVLSDSDRTYNNSIHEEVTQKNNEDQTPEGK